jgi:hypothetical protein
MACGVGVGKQNAALMSSKKTGKLSIVAVPAGPWLASYRSDKLWNMAARTRKALPRNNHLEEAMALLIRNQAAFVEQIARNDQERLALKEWQHHTENWQRHTEDWQRKTEERLANIEATLAALPKTLLQTILDQIPKIRKEIGFKSRT